jgi:hypothetical protein
MNEMPAVLTAVANVPTNNQLGVGINGGSRPHVASAPSGAALANLTFLFLA